MAKVQSLEAKNKKSFKYIKQALVKSFNEAWDEVSEEDTTDLYGFLSIIESLGYRSHDMPNIEMMQDAWELLDGEQCGSVLKRSVEYFILIIEGFY